MGKIDYEAISDMAYTDTDWQNQKQGFYYYAVKTLYNNGAVASDAKLSEILVKDMVNRLQ